MIIETHSSGIHPETKQREYPNDQYDHWIAITSLPFFLSVYRDRGNYRSRGNMFLVTLEKTISK